jgi:hypothetical protein
MARFVARRKRPRAGRRAVSRLQGFQEEGQALFEPVMEAAERSGLLEEKTSRISGRVSPALIAQAKRRTGIESDTELIEFALASIALEDRFAEAFEAAHGTVDPDLKLGY